MMKTRSTASVMILVMKSVIKTMMTIY
uniref:Uncharacterized protein n=1 Tax=Arundo donax TaxID=35708 RepID=A0A0A9BJ23_ARUDO